MKGTDTQASRTPGPWKVWTSREDASVNVIGGMDGLGFVCEVGKIHKGCGDNVQIRADARLIAAAPELLAKLKALVSDPRHVYEGTNALADARELLRSLGEHS